MLYMYMLLSVMSLSVICSDNPDYETVVDNNSGDPYGGATVYEFKKGLLRPDQEKLLDLVDVGKHAVKHLMKDEDSKNKIFAGLMAIHDFNNSNAYDEKGARQYYEKGARQNAIENDSSFMAMKKLLEGNGLYVGFSEYIPRSDYLAGNLGTMTFHLVVSPAPINSTETHYMQ